MTLLETLVAVSVFLLIMGGVAMFQKSVFYYTKIVSNSLETVQDAQVILKVIERDIRTMSPGSDGAYPIVFVSTSSLTFYSDTDGDGLKEKIRYFLDGTILRKSKIKPVINPVIYRPTDEVISQIVKNIRNSSSTPVFQYYDGSYVNTSNPLIYPIDVTDVRLIKISLTADIDPNEAPIQRTYTSSVTLRNLKDNL